MSLSQTIALTIWVGVGLVLCYLVHKYRPKIKPLEVIWIVVLWPITATIRSILDIARK